VIWAGKGYQTLKAVVAGGEVFEPLARTNEVLADRIGGRHASEMAAAGGVGGAARSASGVGIHTHWPDVELWIGGLEGK
jgi:hypothetical protein